MSDIFILTRPYIYHNEHHSENTLREREQLYDAKVKRLKEENEILKHEVVHSKEENSIQNGKMTKKMNSDLVTQSEEQEEALKMLREKVTEIESLKNEISRLQAVNLKLNEKWKESRKKAIEMENTNSDLIQNQKELELRHNEMVQKLKAENEKLRDEAAVHGEEQKEAQMKITKLEEKVKEMKMRALDPLKFMEWDWDQIHFWMMGLEGGKFKKYQTIIKESLSRDGVNGEDLLDVNPLVLKAWGVRDGADSKGLCQYILELVSNQDAVNDAP